MYRCSCNAPNRVWERTTGDLWASRDWYPGEKAEYERKVLGR